MNKSVDYYSSDRSDVSSLIPIECARILDVGCGFGVLGRNLRRRGWEQIYGVEINSESMSWLEGIYTDFWVADAERFSLPENTEPFDCIIFADVLEHLCDPWETLNRYMQWLKPGGFVLVSIPNVRNIALIYNLIFRGRWHYQDSGLLDKTHLRFFTRYEIVSLLTGAGLEIDLVTGKRDRLSTLKRILTFPLLCLVPDLGVCQFLVRARLP